jgi:hypothetical protein
MLLRMRCTDVATGWAARPSIAGTDAGVRRCRRTLSCDAVDERCRATLSTILLISAQIPLQRRSTAFGMSSTTPGVVASRAWVSVSVSVSVGGGDAT